MGLNKVGTTIAKVVFNKWFKCKISHYRFTGNRNVYHKHHHREF